MVAHPRFTMKLSDIVALFKSEPKTLDQAKTTLASAGASLDSVSSLFTAAGLNLDTMLAAGPDSLKAHLASLDQNEGIEAMKGELATAKSALTAAQATASELTAKVTTLTAQAAELGGIITQIGFDPKAVGSDGKPQDVKSAFAAHVAKAATAELAKHGIAPVAAITKKATEQAATLTDEQHLAAYAKMPPGKERQAYATKFHEQIRRADLAAR